MSTQPPNSKGPVRIGFIPLIDAAPVIVAAAEGFAAAEGLDLVLTRETSWANIRDKISVGHFDVAHMLAPMPIAQNLGLGPLPAHLSAVMALGFGGNTITVSRKLGEEITRADPLAIGDPLASAKALAAAFAARRAARHPRPTLGIVHPYSAHHYQLAYWIAAAGIVPGRDVDLVVLPPPLMPDALASGQIDGFCAGEPWGSTAVERGVGLVIATNPQIWRASPEKVLGVRTDWADANRDTVLALIRAVHRAAVWADDPANEARLAAILGAVSVIGDRASTVAIQSSLARRRLTYERSGALDFLLFAGKAATFPWSSHALWFFSQMVRWGQVPFARERIEIVRRSFRPDLTRAALQPIGVTLPSANAKIEGALQAPTPVASPTGRLMLGPDGFFDGRVFDPDQLEAYIAGFA